MGNLPDMTNTERDKLISHWRSIQPATLHPQVCDSCTRTLDDDMPYTDVRDWATDGTIWVCPECRSEQEENEE